MNREEWHRLLIHTPWGLLAIGLYLLDPLIAAVACLMELGYEFINDWRKHDKSYKDVVGIVWGILLGGYILLALKLLGI